MHRLLVILQVLLAPKHCTTGRTFLAQVVLRRNVTSHRRLVVKLLLAMRTFVAIFARMMEHVILQLRALDKGHSTLLALV